jgi:hypothetical protein
LTISTQLLATAFGILAGALLLVVAIQQWRLTHSSNRASYREGFEAGRAEVLNSITYEQEILETRRSGVMRKETALKIRERVMLGNLRIAETEREVVLTSEVNEENVWNVLDQARGLLLAGNPSAASVDRLIAPAAKVILRGKKN